MSCDLDHTSPYPAGRTCECNLRPLCRHHHNLKTHTRWSCRLASGPDHPPGTLEWTSPTGRILHSEPGLPDLLNWWTPPRRTQPPEPDPQPEPAPRPEPEDPPF